MTLITFEKYGIRLGEQRFVSDFSAAAVDLLFALQLPAPIPGSTSKPVATWVLRLDQAEEALLAGMNDTTRYEIRRAEQKDRLSYHGSAAPGAEELGEFLRFFGSFAARRGLERPSAEHLKRYASAGCLDLSCARTQEGGALCWHAHFVDLGRARLLHSASLRLEESGERRNLVGRANRWLHWRDILRFRSQGCRSYDFGGIYLGESDAEQLRIRSFKEKFGGYREDGFNCELPLSWRGRLYSWLRRLKGGAS